MDNSSIIIKNARVHNLKGVDVSIPRNKFIVITGLSGSGKSSLAFDTLYAEGQRRYVESLSSYVRQFLGRMDKPEVDMITGLPPAIAIEQKVISNNPRSTVGTTTEIYEYLKLLFARIGRTYSPISGVEVKRHTVDDVLHHILSQSEGTVAMLYTTIPEQYISDLAAYLSVLSSRGFSRVEIDGEISRISDLVADESKLKGVRKLRLVVDRVAVSSSSELANRLYDSIETAFSEGDERCVVAVQTEKGWRNKEFSKRFEADGLTFDIPTAHMFAFNSPIGACPECEGYGKILGIDPDLVVPDQSLSIYQDAVMCWRGAVMGKIKQELVANADKFNFPIHTPYYKLTEAQKQLLWTGNRYFMGLNDFFKDVESHLYKIQYRVMLSRYRGKTVCPHCNGTRLNAKANNVKINDHSISQLVEMSIDDLVAFFSDIKLTPNEKKIAKRLLVEITSRLGFLQNVGLGYLTLNRLSNTLSGGESQRINLAKSLGSALVGSLYVLDEPSIGLHPRDTARLIKVLRQLQELGNTVVVVEHDEEIMMAADYLIDIGPEAGRHGGEVVASFPIADLNKLSIFNSHTFNYLTGKSTILVPSQRRKTSKFVEIKGAAHNNLKGIDVKFPLGVMTAVTGVSGSGKSSLVCTVLYNALCKQLNLKVDDKAIYGSLVGSLDLIKSVEIVTQNPIGKSTRSNPVTYLKVYDEIRRLYADQQLSRQMEYTPSHFSFNIDGGRCPECQGEGIVTVPMQFMADLQLKCEACQGRRFTSDILEVKFNGASIHDVLEMTVNQAIEFFTAANTPLTTRIARHLQPLKDVGIGYVKLGQSSSTLSGGENQRVKLAYYLSQEMKDNHTFFIFDEPTTGLHSHDIHTLMQALELLIKRGHTVLVIEHNVDVIKCADYVIDIGPEGGDKGGYVVAAGTPEQVVKCAESYTAIALKNRGVK